MCIYVSYPISKHLFVFDFYLFLFIYIQLFIWSMNYIY